MRLALFVLIAVSLSAGSAGATAQSSGSFKTPSGNIVCAYAYGGGGVSYVQCGIKSGLRPVPPKPKNCQGDYVHDRISVTGTGRTSTYPCAGDVGPFAQASTARVLPYGSTWRGGPIRCQSAVSGLTCRNLVGHGFFLSRERWRSF